jgi:structural maintenance of chromosome 4
MSSNPYEGMPPRLMIQNITVENFKSYAGVKEIGPFHKNFTAVVGPNGSGKSNVIDSMLFVFGRKAKKLRMDKLSELIHNSDEFPNCNFCRVDIAMCMIQDVSDHDFTVVEGSEFVVGRSVDKSDVSTYFINGKKSSKGQVEEIMLSHGMDLQNNRFLILQGEVEQISLMKPKGMANGEEGLLEHVEDVIGSGKFVELIENEAKALESIGEERSKAVHLLNIAEKEANQYLDAKNEAESYLKLQRQLLADRTLAAQRNLWEANQKAETIKEKIIGLESDLERESSNNVNKVERLKDLQQEQKQSAKELQEAVKAMEQTKKEFNSFERRDIEYREQLKHKKKTLKKMEVELEKLESSLATSNQESVHAKNQVAELEKKIQGLQSDMEAEKDKLNTLLAPHADVLAKLNHEMEEAQQTLAPFAAAINEASAKHAVQKGALEQLQAKETELMQQKTATEEKVATAKQEVKQAQKRCSESKGRVSQLQEQLTQKRQDLSHLQQEETRLRKETQDIRVRVEEGARDKQQESSRNAVLKQLLKACSEGFLTGVHGRLGDLARIDRKYDTAISTACGALHHIVVDNQENAQKCVEYLRQHNLGRATFIILSVMEQYAKMAERSIELPVGSQRLFDLIQPDSPQYRPAFFYALNNTLVASTLDEASLWAYPQAANAAKSSGGASSRRWRVVTLEGVLIDSVGTMSGGGKTVAKGGMLLLGDAAQKKVMSQKAGGRDGAAAVVSAQDESALKKGLQQLQQIQAEMKTLRTEIAKMEKMLREAVNGVEEAQSAVETAENAAQQSEVDRQMAESEWQEETQSPSARKAISQCQGEVKKLQVALDRAESNASEGKSNVERIRGAMDQVGGVPVISVRERLRFMSGELERSSAQLAQATVTASSKLLDRASKTVETKRKHVETLQSDIETAMQEWKQLEEDAFKVSSSFEECQQFVSEREKQVEVLQKEFALLQKEVHAYEKIKHGLEMKLENERAEEATQTANMEQYRAQITSLRRQATQMELPAEVVEQIKEEQTHAALEEDLEGETLSKIRRSELSATIAMHEDTIASMTPNMSAILEYAEKKRKYDEQFAQVEALTVQRNESRGRHDALRKQRLEEFMHGFSIISMKLKEMYQMLTLGGDAELELVDSLDPFSEGIVFSVRPPGKSWKNIANLSGGEKTLSSLSLVFALHHFRPTPLYVMDEIDAALDFRNVSIIANYIKERTKNAQFIIISLRNNMFELADRLVGIYKTHNATKSVTVDPAMFVQPQPAAAAPMTAEEKETTQAGVIV